VLRSLRAFFRWVERDDDCREEGLKPWHKALPAIPRSSPKKFVPERADVKRFMATINVNGTIGMRDYVAMSLLLDTGMRIGELSLLTTDNLKLDDRRLIVPNKGKTGTRLLTISSDMARLLKAWLKHRLSYAKTDFLFPAKNGMGASPNTFRLAFSKYRKRSGIKGITPHTLRHCFCTYFLEGGGDIAKLQALSGHSSLDALRVYLNLSGKALEEEQERVSPLRQVRVARA
jgi:integrase/recombinase XerD